MRSVVVMGFVAVVALAGCGGEEGGDPAGSGGAGADTGGAGGAGTGGGSPASGGTPATGGGTATGGSKSGAGGQSPLGPNVYPDGETVVACFGQCPRGECDDAGFFADVSCDAAYPAPVDETSSYCGSRSANYCLEVENGAMFGVVCSGGTATVIHCPEECGAGTGGLECG